MTPKEPTNKELREENRILSIRLSLAQAFAGVLQVAYDALLHYGINFRTLPEYTNDRALDEANAMPIQEGRTRIMDWLGRVERGIAAAIRRKQFKKV